MRFAVAILTAAALAGCGGVDVPEFAPSTRAAGPSSTAAAALATLPIKGRAPKTGYTRDQFGQAWTDVDENQCDTRNDVLRRDLDDITFRPGTQDCIVAAGILHDPYTGRTVTFRRGQDTSEQVQIDHVVALSNAWQTGAQQVTPHEREWLANDPANLLAVDGSTNQAKGDGDAATWLPPVKSYRCRYVARQVAVKAAHQLWVTPPERDAMARILDGCPGEPLPVNRKGQHR